MISTKCPPSVARDMESTACLACHFVFMRGVAGEYGRFCCCVVYVDSEEVYRSPPGPAHSEKRPAARLSMARHVVTTLRTDIILLAFLAAVDLEKRDEEAREH